MQLKRDTAFWILFLFFSTISYAQTDSNSRENAMEEALSSTQTRASSIEKMLQAIEENQTKDIETGIYPSGLFPNIERGRVIEKTLGKIEFALAIGIGHLSGDTSYEINFFQSGSSGKSELVFPFDNWVAGGNISAGYCPLYLNFQGWTNIVRKTSGGMTDKDWEDEVLYSSTESDNEAQILILDANLLYNFWQGDKPWGDVSNGFQKGRFGLLIGYRYENFKYDIIGYRDLLSCGCPAYYQGVKVLDYEVQYRIPYLGLNLQYSNDVDDKFLDSWGLNLQVCGSPYVIAKDRDDHLLREKLIEGHTKGYAFLMGLNTFLMTKNNWIWRLGFDYTWIGTKGKQNQYWYDGSGYSAEGISLRIGSAQYLFWGLLQYNF